MAKANTERRVFYDVWSRQPGAVTEWVHEAPASTKKEAIEFARWKRATDDVRITKTVETTTEEVVREYKRKAAKGARDA